MKRLLFFIILLISSQLYANESKKQLVYIVSDMNIPFWEIMSKGITNSSDKLGYEVAIYDAKNSPKHELELTIKAINNKVDGIIISPTNSSACSTVLKLAENANIPVVVSDVGSDSGKFVSYISSNNKLGAYEIGKLLSVSMLKRGWQDGRVGIIAIPQKRKNGQERTAGFMKALDEAKIKGADIKQLKTWSDQESYNYAKDMISNYPNLRAIWLQTSNIYKGVINAIEDSGKKDDILLITFDAEPEFLELIPKSILLGSGMQQPYLMGQNAIYAMNNYLLGKKVDNNIELPILIISKENIKEKLPEIMLNVLGVE